MALLEVKDLKTSFFSYAGEVQAVAGVSFSLEPGEAIALVGESGCGKSVTALSIMGLINPPGKIVDGTVVFNGKELTGLRERNLCAIRGNEIGMIFQDPMTSLNPVLSIHTQIVEALRLHANLRGPVATKRALELLEMVGIPSPEQRIKQYPHQFSGGQRQRIGVARALAVEPKFIICDEPISALDVSIQAQIVNLLQELQDSLGLTYLFIAHDLAMVKHLSDRVIVMYLGKIVEEAPSVELYENPLHPYTQALLSAVPIPDPDVELTRRRIILRGDVPSPLNPPKGCRFHTRCAKRDPACAFDPPALKSIGPGHRIACHF